jgi:putative solute:sodium symporter small subunit
MIVYLIWLSFVVVWNFGYPDASPFSDIVAAVFFSFLSSKINNLLKPYNRKYTMKKDEKYWYENIELIVKCLLIWFTVSYIFGILIVHDLNLIKIGGYKLGFWFAQQGSIFTFVLLIFYYSKKIGDLDKKYKN